MGRRHIAGPFLLNANNFLVDFLALATYPGSPTR